MPLIVVVHLFVRRHRIALFTQHFFAPLVAITNSRDRPDYRINAFAAVVHDVLFIPFASWDNTVKGSTVLTSCHWTETVTGVARKLRVQYKM